MKKNQIKSHAGRPAISLPIPLQNAAAKFTVNSIMAAFSRRGKTVTRPTVTNCLNRLLVSRKIKLVETRRPVGGVGAPSRVYKSVVRKSRQPAAA